MEILSKNIYEVKYNNINQWVLVIYSISANHHVAIPVYNNPMKDAIYISSIKKHVIVKNIKDYGKNVFKRTIYIGGNVLSVTEKDFELINIQIKKHFIDILNQQIKVDADNLSYLKWCHDKWLLNNAKQRNKLLTQNGVYWVEFGYNVGTELRKLRPAVLWRPSSDRLKWTVIPLTTKCNNDKYYFHYDLECLPEGTVKIDCMINVSCKRIKEPYFYNHKGVLITNNDYDNIKRKIGQYYMFNPLNK